MFNSADAKSRPGKGGPENGGYNQIVLDRTATIRMRRTYARLRRHGTPRWLAHAAVWDAIFDLTSIGTTATFHGTSGYVGHTKTEAVRGI